jgi:hypothetical protein
MGKEWYINGWGRDNMEYWLPARAGCQCSILYTTRLPAQLPAAADVSVPSNWGTDTSRRTRTRRNARRELGQGKQRGKRSASAAVPSHPNMNFGYAAIAILLIQLHVFNVEMPFAAAVQVTTHEQLLDFGLPFHGRICVRDTVLLMLVQLRVPRCSF